MARYKLSTRGVCSEIKEFKTDKAAWNNLRKNYIFKESNGTVSGLFIYLFKEIEVEVDINNEVEYVKQYNAKYGYHSLNAGEKITTTTWMPVLAGNTSHQYKINKKKTKK